MIANSYDLSPRAEDDFISGFTARQDTLDTFRRRLVGIGPNGFGEHYVIVGPSGSGKTTLLRRLEIEIRNNPDLSEHFIPLSFNGEERDTLALDEFWNTAIETLAKYRASCPGPNSGQDSLTTKQNPPVKTGFSGEFFEEQMFGTGKRVVLLVDDFDLTMKSLDARQDQWSLRKTLLVRDGPIMIGTGEKCPEYFFQDYHSAFHQFFYPTHLEPLIPDNFMEPDPI